MLTGMELIDAIRRQEAEPPSGIRTLGLDRTHHWLTKVEPGVVELVWDVEPAYQNLEGAVICSWIAALADQALFFASDTLCGAGESTRMRSLQMECLHNITDGSVRIVGTVRGRTDDDLWCTCEFFDASDELLAHVSATIEIRKD